jgi:PhoH-like ATPase
MAKKIYILDTSVCLTDANCIRSYGNNDIVLPLKVLEEIDNNKKRQDGCGTNARTIIRNLDALREKGSLSKGVRIDKGKGLICVKMVKKEGLPEDLDLRVPDNEIISVALNQKNENPKRKVIVVTRDINMRVKCDSLGLTTEDFQSDQVVKDTDNIYTGFVTHLVDEPILDQFYAGEDIFIDKEELNLNPNQFLMLVSNQNEKKTALGRFTCYSEPIKLLNSNSKRNIWGLKPRNKEQIFAMDLLEDQKINVITLVGKAGCGKTLLAIAAGLSQVVEKGTYSRLVVSRPIQPMGRDIGYLPGSMEEKMSPWVAPIKDNLEFLMANDKSALETYMKQGRIEVEALTYIRGRSIANAFIIIDEAQNLTAHELKTILTRVGENTKIVLTGDIEQIDNVYLDETSNGLTHAVEKFKSFEVSGHVTLLRGERSKVATIASKIL